MRAKYQCWAWGTVTVVNRMMMRRQYLWRHEDHRNGGRQEQKGRCVGVGLSPYFNLGTGYRRWVLQVARDVQV